MIFTDTSVLVAYLCPEALHASAVQAMSKQSVRLITPLVQVEVASALSLKTRTGEMDAGSARRVLEELTHLLDEGVFAIREVAIHDYLVALQWLGTFSTPLRANDAVHLACAHNHKVTMLTADRQLAASAKALGVRHKLIR